MIMALQAIEKTTLTEARLLISGLLEAERRKCRRKYLAVSRKSLMQAAAAGSIEIEDDELPSFMRSVF